MGRVQILLVEDDPEHRRLLGRVVCEHHPEVDLRIADTLDAFEREIRDRQFDCALIDYHFAADCDADRLLTRLRELQPRCPAIIISSDSRQDVAVRSLRFGGADFIRKDEITDGTYLWERLRSVLRERRQQDRDRRRMGRRMERLLAEAETDPLTGLANRRRIDQILDDPRRRMCDRRGGCSVIMLDLDHFKRINDENGHACGDEVLKLAAQLIRSTVPDTALAARWGGEEFLILLPGTPLARAMYVAEHMRRRMAYAETAVEGGLIQITVSAGVATAAHDCLDRGTLIQADRALYLAKECGRNQVRSWDMVVFRDHIEQARHGTKSPERRWQRVLDRAWSALGPTQREHLSAHSDAVSRIVNDLGRELRLAPESRRALRLAGKLHDAGKLTVPDDILAKATPLTGEERFLISRLADDAAELSRVLGVDKHVCDWIRHHHRRFGDEPETPYASSGGGAFEPQLLNVADALAAMTSNRPYQPARSIPAALRELRQQRGRQFNPRAVDAALACFGSPKADSAQAERPVEAEDSLVGVTTRVS